MDEAQARFGAERMSHAIEPSSLHVLVVDRGDESRASIARLLEESHYQVTAVKHGKQALDLLQKPDAKYDLVIKEHEPPRVNGCKLLKEMAKDEKLQSVPVVVISSRDDTEAVVKCTHLGAADYLVKPLRRNEVRHIWTRVWWKRAGHANHPPMIMVDEQANTLKRNRSNDGMDESSFNSGKQDSGGNHANAHKDKKAKDKVRKGSTGSTEDLAQEENSKPSAFKSFPGGAHAPCELEPEIRRHDTSKPHSNVGTSRPDNLREWDPISRGKQAEAPGPEEPMLMGRDQQQQYPCPMVAMPPAYPGAPFPVPQMGGPYPQFYSFPYMYGMPPVGMGSQVYQSSGSFPSWPGSHSNSGGNGQYTSDAHMQTNGTNGNSGSGGTSGEKESAQQTHGNQADGFESVPEHVQRRQHALDKFKLKKKMLNFSKTIRYTARKHLADARPRVRGQFVKLNQDSPAPVDSTDKEGAPNPTSSR